MDTALHILVSKCLELVFNITNTRGPYPWGIDQRYRSGFGKEVSVDGVDNKYVESGFL